MPDSVVEVEDVDHAVADGRDDRLIDVEIQVDEHGRHPREETDIVGGVHLDDGRVRRTRRCRRAPGRHGRRSAPPVGSGATARAAPGRVRRSRRARRAKVSVARARSSAEASRPKRSWPVKTSSAYPLGCEATTAPSMSNPTSANAAAAVARSPVRSGATMVQRHRSPGSSAQSTARSRASRRSRCRASSGARERARVGRRHRVEVLGGGLLAHRPGQVAVARRRRPGRRLRPPATRRPSPRRAPHQRCLAGVPRRRAGGARVADGERVQQRRCARCRRPPPRSG